MLSGFRSRASVMSQLDFLGKDAKPTGQLATSNVR